MTGLLLPALCGLVAALFAAALAALFAGARLGQRATLALCGAGVALDVAYLAAGAPPATLSVPVGLPGSGILLGLDGVSAFTLLIVLLVGAAAAAAALDEPGEDAAAKLLPALIAAIALLLLAADAFSLVLGFGLMGLAASALVVGDHRDPAARAAGLRTFAFTAAGVACLVPAMAWLAHLEPWGPDLSFSGIRAHPPEGWRAVAVLALTLTGGGGLAGLFWQSWLPGALAASSAPVAALLASGMTNAALYLLIRVPFDLSGPAQGAWWGVPLLALGAAGAVLGGLRANAEGDLKAVIGAAAAANVGLVTAGLGIALVARANDVPALAALALGGALVLALAYGLFAALLCVIAGSVRRGAGTRHLERLGGLIQQMKVTTACALLAAACVAFLPPGSGFAGAWLLFQALFAAPRGGVMPQQMLFAATGLAMALAVGLLAAASVRLVGVGFLGRPRTPRAAAAQEVGRPAQAAMVGLAGASGLVGLFPGIVLAAAAPAVRALTGGTVARTSVFAVAPQASGYIPLGVTLMAAVALLAVLRGLRAGGPVTFSGRVWDGGGPPPPLWLPFGDPLTQIGAAGFSDTLSRLVSALLPAAGSLTRPARRAAAWLTAWADRAQTLSVRQALSATLSVLVLLLAAVALVEHL